MAVKDSEELGINDRYPLGEYSFRVERSAGTSPNYDKIEAICTKGGKNARKSIQVPSSTKMDGWYVEANETEASVYIRIESVNRGNKTFSAGSFYVNISNAPSDIECHWWTGKFGNSYYNDCTLMTKNPPLGSISGNNRYSGQAGVSQGITFQTLVFSVTDAPLFPVTTIVNADATLVPGWWSGGGTKSYRDVLVGRFVIDLGDAGGEGPGSDWDDPGDYDPDWEPDDPTHTLYVTATGALSGRHNDPIEDPSYSYIPSDKDTVKDYGCGGDGGHGGGGGAGASTVIVHKFATNQANSKEVTAIARRHGYGSGGGKGGKGGDGCILVYY